MKNVSQTIRTGVSLLLAILLVSCATPGERMAQANRHWASLIVGEKVFVNSEGKPVGKMTLNEDGSAWNFPGEHLFPVEARCFYHKSLWRFEEPAKLVITCKGYSDDPVYEAALEIRSFSSADTALCAPCAKTPDQFVVLSDPSGSIFLLTSQKRLEKARKASLPSEEALRQQWAGINRSRCKAISDFKDTVPDDYKDLKASVGSAFSSCVDGKVLNYFRKTYPRLAQYGDQPIYFANGTRSEAKLAELFDGMVLGRNPDSGFKMEPKDFRIEILTDDTFQLIMNVEGKNMQFDFKIFSGKVNVVGLSAGWERNPRGWEVAAESAFQMFYKYPASGYWDWPYIDSL